MRAIVEVPQLQAPRFLRLERLDERMKDIE
jgi:hypothetical protein